MHPNIITRAGIKNVSKFRVFFLDVHLQDVQIADDDEIVPSA